MKVLKFGGSSVSSTERIRDVARIILEAARREPLIVVVSAFHGVTNTLLEAAALAEKGDARWEALFDEIAVRHRNVVAQLLSVEVQRTTHEAIETMLTELHEVLHGISLLRHAPPRALDLIASFGERMSATVLAAYLKPLHPAIYVDARALIVTDDRFTDAAVFFDKTNAAVRTYFKKLLSGRAKGTIPVVTGFIGATEDGLTTTIGRNGSDYTASILGAALGASMIEIWTDVDGVLSADPRTVHSAFVLPHMSYEEAMELSYFGAKVLHPATIAPAVTEQIPVHIRNTLHPEVPGTVISRSSGGEDGVAKGITSVDDITLLTLRGLNMVGVPGTAERLFGTLAAQRINVILISQASSEHTICFAVINADAARAHQAISREFRHELKEHMTSLDQKARQTVVAVVGEGMRGTPGVAGSVFQALGRNNINVSAIAQGASERNISFVIDSALRSRALNVIHEAFFEKRKRVSLVVIGTGNIGSALLHQLNQQRSYLHSQGFEVSVCGVANSRKIHIDPEGIALERWKEELTASSRRMEMAELVHQLMDLELTNAALVDCTASTEGQIRCAANHRPGSTHRPIQ